MPRLIIYIFILFLPCLAVAANGGGAGEIAGELMVPTKLLLSFVKTASIFVGLFCLFGAINYYMEHKVNPVSHPLGTAILLFIIGIVLICLPYISYLIKNFPSFLSG